MLTYEMKEILQASVKTGWILEPLAKRLFSLAGMEVPRYVSTKRVEEAALFSKQIGYPVVAKVVSPNVIHKSEKNGVVVGIGSEEKLREIFDRFSKIEGFIEVLVEEMVSGVELIVGATNDFQFGPVILLGTGGIWAEIYKDVVLRMAPLTRKDIDSMKRCLKAHPLLEGYRGAEPINSEALNQLLLTFSDLVMALEQDFESIDLNPVICDSKRCVIADARIMLKK
ncbi:MAG: acetyl-CoA synthetase [Deltaproteobacteria bacterium]|nr:acetyl-CoA synthetase [Deltaproteobacteria bacterium]